MMLAVVDQALGNLLRRGYAEVSEYRAMQRARIVKVNDAFDEVGTVRRQQFVKSDVAARVEDLDQFVVFVRRRFDLKRVKGAVISGADQLIPRSIRRFAVLAIRNDRFKILPAIPITQERLQLGIGI